MPASVQQSCCSRKKPQATDNGAGGPQALSMSQTWFFSNSVVWHNSSTRQSPGHHRFILLSTGRSQQKLNQEDTWLRIQPSSLALGQLAQHILQHTTLGYRLPHVFATEMGAFSTTALAQSRSTTSSHNPWQNFLLAARSLGRGLGPATFLTKQALPLGSPLLHDHYQSPSLWPGTAQPKPGHKLSARTHPCCTYSALPQAAPPLLKHSAWVNLQSNGSQHAKADCNFDQVHLSDLISAKRLAARSANMCSRPA
jgi:hypothetical protein